MKYSYSTAFLWLTIYLLLSLAPLAIAFWGDLPDYRSFWTEFAVVLGFIGLGMFALQFVFSGRLKQIVPTYGMDNILHFHKTVGIIAFLFVLAHPALLFLTNPDFIYYLDPHINLIRAIALSVVMVSLIALTVTSLWRISFRLSYEKWRIIHGLLALVVVFIGVVHALQVGHYLDNLWKKGSLVFVMGSSMYLVIYTRIVRPMRNRKRPYQIVEVKEERGSCWTLRLEPIKHQKMQHQPGQFAWITINDSPFTLQQHPFSIASSTKDKAILFTAKESGDFTSTWRNIKVGSKAYLEGPFGSFIPIKGKHLFLVMGGIGITPAMGMLRTMRDEKDTRKVILIYGFKDWENVPFREELIELSNTISLKIIHLVNNPPKEWKGETGIIHQEMIQKYLPQNKNNYMYFICGPELMMDVTEIALRNLGVDWRHIYTERFNIV